MEPYWREALSGMDGGEQIVEAVIGADEEPAARRVEEREHHDEPEAGSHVAHLAEEFARHYATHGVLPPAELAEHMFETARENDEFAAERAVEERAATGDAHWRFAVGDDALVESMLGGAG
jgi:hypothetical protein